MRKLIALIVVLAFFGFKTPGPVDCQCGVYRTADDYKNNEMIPGIKVSQGIRYSWNGITETIKLKTSDTTLTYKAGNAFAYLDENCKLFRFYKKDVFVEVMSNESICIYKYYKTAFINYGDAEGTTYYFSRDMYSPIIDLSRRNLILEYTDMSQFTNAVSKLKYESDLTRLDPYTHKLKVVSLYEQNGN